ncbi:MAG: tRNA (adenosine(37)-N6)-threonylcarbamoyltransferase complex ATPase subunit type 1 TsaE [Bacteroidia bacterium]|nr:tRNA (adenosine(37)-N6)-threonylcarbamoyltransferase complex ATPase subunit type 1 TsaE [Bacteroidia bacterium]
MISARQVYEQVSLEDLDRVAARLLDLARSQKVWLFHGEMGAGKTTLIKALCRRLGVEDAMSSPSFSIINEYRTAGGEAVYHFDFYRIKDEAEAYDIGTEEYLDSANYCFIEWPEKIPSLIPSAHTAVHISTPQPTYRTIAITLNDREEENRI